MSDFSGVPFHLELDTDTLSSIFTPSFSRISSLYSDSGDFSSEQPPQLDLNAEPQQSDLNVKTPQCSSDFDCCEFESSNIDDAIMGYSELYEALADEPRVVDINSGSDGEGFHMNIGDDNWETSLFRELATEDEQGSPYENLSMSMDSLEELLLSSLGEEEEEEDSNMNLDWGQVSPIDDDDDDDDDVVDSFMEFLMFEVDYTQRRSSAAKVVVENLPLVDLRKEDMIVCAICRDEIEEGEIVNRLPCSHYYHRACIVPWLELRNTCPVCRYELPTYDQSVGSYDSRSRSRSRSSRA